jgi:ribosomal protein S18 acetylase RimI-like enzyme
MGGFAPQVILCPVEARWEALEVLYRRVPSVLRDRLIAEVLEEAERGEIDLSGLWVVREWSGRITGSLLTQPLAGKAAAVWAPEVKRPWRRSKLAAMLIQAALADLKARGFHLAQAVLDESADPRAGRDLTRGGMPHITELVYLERDTSTPLPPAKGAGRESPGRGFQWQPYSPEIEAEFHAVLQATYVGSLDMPELEGARGLDDILTGYRSAGRFLPQRWQLGRIAGEPEAAAVLLLAELPGRDAWEVIYLGLTPAARGRGLGRALLQHALELARDHVPVIELAVDRRNTPAVRLYRAAGFTVRDRRTVYLAILGGRSAASTPPEILGTPSPWSPAS